MRGRSVEAVSVHVLDDDLVRQADAEGKLAVKRESGSKGLLGEHCRMSRVGRYDRGAHLDAMHAVARDGKSRQGIKPEDVGHPGRREAVVHGHQKLVTEHAQRLRALRLGQGCSDAHVNSVSAMASCRGYWMSIG